MTVVSAIPAIQQGVNRIRYPVIDISDVMASSGGSSSSSSSSRRGEIEEERQSPLTLIEDKIYVAVGKELKRNELNLEWALHNSVERKICILHVHRPAQRIPVMGTKFPISQMEEQEVRAYHELERQDMLKLLDKYGQICERAGVQAEKIDIEMDSIEKGIVKLVSQHNIRKLAMGAAADKQYSRKMKEVRSKKAMYVRQEAPDFCHIQFICKGQLIYEREGKAGGVNEEFGLPIQASPSSETGQSNPLKSRSVVEGQNNFIKMQDYRRSKSENPGIMISGMHSTTGSVGSTHHSMLNGQERLVEREEIKRSASEVSQCSTCSSGELIEDFVSLSIPRTSESDVSLELIPLPHSVNDQARSSPPTVQEGGTKDELYDRLLQFVTEANNSRWEAYEESIKCRKAEKEAIEAIRRAKSSETLYVKESRQRKEIEEALQKGKEEVEKLKLQLDEVSQELHNALEQKAYLESQIASADRTVQELEEKMFSAVELLQKYKNESDDMQVERDNALRVAEELRKRQVDEDSCRDVPRFFSEFSLSEIEEATRSFDPTLKIGEGGYGSIYKGLLCHTEVAIKMLNSQSSQGPSEFQQEVNVLTKLRHPNLITLIGTCPEAFILVYEYLPNGSLEDRLCCRDNTPPLSWQSRIRIVAELCSVLIFLHSSSPHSIVHGDLKPANILLDANYVSKLSDFGICRVISQDEYSSNDTTLCCRTGPKGTFAYMDPEFLSTGELTSKSDVYSFGIILLRLLTGRSALGITKEVQYALEKGNLKDILDSTAGDWPFVLAERLAHLAMRCCDLNRRNRPDLASDIWRVLEPMRVSCGSSSLGLGSEEHCQIPPYFVCPIFQEIMQDPVVAADGFTYEAEALKGWLDSGHDTSPMTNLQLAHCNLVPNRALRSAIQEWLQQP